MSDKLIFFKKIKNKKLRLSLTDFSYAVYITFKILFNIDIFKR
jgi:hypothetical protein